MIYIKISILKQLNYIKYFFVIDSFDISLKSGNSVHPLAFYCTYHREHFSCCFLFFGKIVLSCQFATVF